MRGKGFRNSFCKITELLGCNLSRVKKVPLRLVVTYNNYTNKYSKFVDFYSKQFILNYFYSIENAVTLKK